MSTFETQPGLKLSTVRVPDAGTEVLLSKEERALQTRLLSSPETFPEAFKSFLTNWMAVNGPLISSSQVVGGVSGAIESYVAASDACSDTDYADLANEGPKFTGLRDGSYLFIFGANYTSAAGGDGFMAPSFNGSAASDTDAAFEQPSSANRFCIMRGLIERLDNDNNNTVTWQYRVSSGTNAFGSRWAVGMRVGN